MIGYSPTGPEGPAAKGSVLLLGNYRPTLTVARALAADGFHVVLGLDHDGEGGAQFSAAVDEVWAHSSLDADDGRSFRDELDAWLASRPDIRIVYPIAEKFVRWCAENDDLLAGRVTVASPAPDLVLQCLDKARMVQLAQEAEVPCRPFRAVANLDELALAAAELGYPVVVRPLSHHSRLGAKKAIVAADRQGLQAALPAWPAAQNRLLVQGYAPGSRRDVYFAAQRGEALRLLEVRIVRTDSIDGTGLSVEGELVALSPVLADHVRRLLKTLDYTGIGCAQFLVDPADGAVCFLEVNPRVAGSHRCAEWAGMDLTRLAIRLAEDRAETGDDRFAYRPGGIYAWTYGDLGGLKTGISNREVSFRQALAWLGTCALSWLRADFHLTFDIRDPLPTLVVFARRLRLPRRRAANKPAAASIRIDQPLGA